MPARSRTGPLRGRGKPLELKTGLELRVCKPRALECESESGLKWKFRLRGAVGHVGGWRGQCRDDASPVERERV